VTETVAQTDDGAGGSERTDTPFRAGMVAIMGRPNVGKSTLLNALLGMKLAAVSPKPQTSRQQMLGVIHGPNFQIGLLDTPGWPASPRTDALASGMMRHAREALDSADLVILMVEPPRPPGQVERDIVQEILSADPPLPTLAIINKIDTVRKSALLPMIESYVELHPFLEIIPTSVLNDEGLELVVQRVVANLPVAEPLFPEDQLTDRTERFIASEIIREKVFEQFGDEIPYATAIRIEEFVEASEDHGGKDLIEATVFVDRSTQKAILVGHQGEGMKSVGTAARSVIEDTFGRPVFLSLWVKVRRDWRRDQQFVRSLENQ
jgi:GTP-binding protein Era